MPARWSSTLVALVVAILLAPMLALAPSAGAVGAPVDGPERATAASPAVDEPVEPRAMDPEDYQPLTPSRVLDTREGNGAPEGLLGPAQTITLDVTGRGGVPDTGVGAVVLNITSTQADAEAFITAWPTGTTRPLASNVNTDPGTDTPNLAIVKVGAGGTIDLFHSNGHGHLVADVLGWFPTTATYDPLVPVRLLDTRSGIGAPEGILGADATVHLQVTGRGGVPADGVSAVVLNVTSTQADAPSDIVVFPTGDERPHASNLNTDPGTNTPNLAIVEVGDGGAVDLWNRSGHGHLVADVMGWFPEVTAYRPDTPGRMFDTRKDDNPDLAGAFGAKETRLVDLPDAAAHDIGAVVVNITSVNASETSFVTAWPAGVTKPRASNLNTDPGTATPNLAIVPIGVDGDLQFFNNSGTGDLVVDVLGWFPIGTTHVAFDEPGFTGSVEIPDTTVELDPASILSIQQSVTPTGAAVTFELAGAEPYAVGDLVELLASELPAGVVMPPAPGAPTVEEDEEGVPSQNFLGQVTAASAPDPETGMQTLTIVPGTRVVKVRLPITPPGQAEAAAESRHIVLGESPELPDGFLGEVTDIRVVSLSTMEITSVPAPLEDAFVDIDMEVDPGEAIAAQPGRADGLTAEPRLEGSLVLFEASLERVRTGQDTVRSLVGLEPELCNIEGPDAGVKAEIGYQVFISWKWYWFVPIPRVVATLTPKAEAWIELNKVAISCSVALYEKAIKFTIPKTRIGVKVGFDLVLDLEAGVTGIDIGARAWANVTMGYDGRRAAGDRWVFTDDEADATQNLTDLAKLGPEDAKKLSLYVQADLTVGAVLEVAGVTVIRGAMGPFAEFTMSGRSDRPWWSLDIGKAGNLEVLDRKVIDQEVPVLGIMPGLVPACPTVAPWSTNEYTPCLFDPPPDFVRPNGDDRIALFGIDPYWYRLRFSAPDSYDQLRITTTSLPDAIVGEPYRAPGGGPVQLSADGWFIPDTWSIVTTGLPAGYATALPAGLHLDPATGIISGTPTAAPAAALTLRFRVVDAIGGPLPWATKDLTLRVWPRPAVTTGTLTFVEDVPRSYQLEGTGRPNLTWSFAPGFTPPAWMSLTSGGLLTATPPEKVTSAVSVRVTDGNGLHAIATLPIYVVVIDNEQVGGGGDGSPQVVDASADGRVVAFSTRENLTADDVDLNADIYVYDRDAGFTLVEVPDAYGDAIEPSLSDDGGTVAFTQTDATVSGTWRTATVVLADVATGAWIDLGAGVACAPDDLPGVPDGHEATCAPFVDDLESVALTDPSLSGDGSRVAYDAALPTPQVVVYDVPTGTSRLAHLTDAVPGCPNSPGFLDWASRDPSLDGDGSTLAYTAACDGGSVVVSDLDTGVAREVMDSGWHSTEHASVSGDGNRVAFVEDDWESLTIRVWQRSTGVTDIEVGAGWAPALDDDGSDVAYVRSIPGMPSVPPQVMRATLPPAPPSVATLSIKWSGGPSNGESANPVISGDGSVVVYSSRAGDLLDDGPAGLWHPVIHDPDR